MYPPNFVEQSASAGLQVEAEVLSGLDIRQAVVFSESLVVKVYERTPEFTSGNLFEGESLAVPEEGDAHDDVLLIFDHPVRILVRVVDDDRIAELLGMFIREVAQVDAMRGNVDRNEIQRTDPDNGGVDGCHHSSFQRKKGLRPSALSSGLNK